MQHRSNTLKNKLFLTTINSGDKMLIFNAHDQLKNKHKKSKHVYFSRDELTQILNVYSTRVAQGIWRDYALDHHSNSAIFSIFKSCHEMPLYTIEKKQLKGREQWLYSLKDRQKILRQNANLKQTLDYLKNLPHLVNH